MGWDYAKGATKASIVAELIKDRPGYKTIAHKATVDDTLWVVIEHNGQTEIVCYLLGNKKGYGWGYKGGMPEYMHPYYYDCPMDFLDITPVANEDWRAGVRKYHRPISVGQTYTLIGVDDPTISPVTIVKITPEKIVGRDMHNRRWRIVRAQLGDEIKS